MSTQEDLKEDSLNNESKVHLQEDKQEGKLPVKKAGLKSFGDTPGQIVKEFLILTIAVAIIGAAVFFFLVPSHA